LKTPASSYFLSNETCWLKNKYDFPKNKVFWEPKFLILERNERKKRKNKNKNYTKIKRRFF